MYVGICACHKESSEYMDCIVLENDKSDHAKIIAGTLLSIIAEGSTAKTVAAGTVHTR